MQPEAINIYGGKLEAVSRYALVASIRMAALSGTLTFGRGGSRKELNFADGFVVGSSSNQLDDAIGTLLHAWGTITTESYRQLQLKSNQEKRMLFGEHLLAMAAIDRTTLANVLREQILWRVGELFTWPDGTYMFTPGEVTPKTERISYADLFGAAVRYSMGTDHLRFAQSMLLDVKPRPVRDSVFELIVLDEPELAALFDRLTGRISFRGLLGPSEPQRFWQNIFILRELGIIEFDMPPELTALRENKSFDDAQTSRPKPDPESAARALFLRASQRAFEKGKKGLLHRNFDDALRHFTVAITLAPDAGEYHAYRAWTRVQMGPRDTQALERALASLRKATQTAPHSADAAFFHGGVLWLLGQQGPATAEFERVVTLAPGHKAATLVLQRLSQPKI